MAYEKKDTYPLIKKPGIYPEKTIKELGLDNDDLEKFSLGNWNSIVKNNRPFTSDFLKKFTSTIDDQVEIEDVLISLLSSTSPYGNSMGYSNNGLQYRFKIEFYGYYLNPNNLPEYIQNGSTGGTAPGFNYANSADGLDVYIYYPYNPTIFSNPNAPNDLFLFQLSEDQLQAYVDDGTIGNTYIQDIRAAIEFRNWTYEIHKGNFSNLDNNKIYQLFPTVATWDEFYRYEYSTFWDIFDNGRQFGDFAESKIKPMEARIVNQDGDNLGISENTGTPSNPKVFNNSGPVYKNTTGWSNPLLNSTFSDFAEASATRLREWLLANLFFLRSNPIPNDETYGSITDDNPMKIYFGETNQEELNSILNTSMIVDKVPFRKNDFDLQPTGFINKLEHPQDNTQNGALYATMKISPIFDRPKGYFNLNDNNSPDNYDAGDTIPKKYFINQHPNGNTFYDQNVYPFGHWYGNSFQVQDEINYLNNQDWYRRPSYFVASPLTFDDSSNVIIGENNGTILDLYQTIDTYPIFMIDDRDENGDYNVYIPNLTIEEFPGYSMGVDLGSPTETGLLLQAHTNRLTYLTDVLGFPNFPWPPTITIGEEVPDDFETTLQNNFSLFLSTLTTLEYNTSLPGIDQFSINTNKIDFTRNDYNVSDVDFKVYVFFDSDSLENTILKSKIDIIENELLYYDYNNPNYLNSSYPVKVNLALDLFGIDNFTNEQEIIDIDELEEIRADALGGGSENLTSGYLLNKVQSAGSLPENSIYRFQVIQWGDEKTLFSDDAILNSYYFSKYNDEQWPSIFSYSYKKGKQDQILKSKPIIELDENSELTYNLFSHIYTRPGIMSIKIIVYRYTRDSIILLESTLITKNININDGLLRAQDFSIFGGTDFNFLPITENQAIIGGFDEESKYNNSVSKIVKDDNFIKDDYLERVSSRDYIEKFNGGFLGKRPGQLDLGQTRVFTEPKDIYDFIGGNKLEWINQGFGSLPINSLATDIFIRDDKCVVDLNPSNSEYSAIQNQAGLEGVGVLIGDYKINQPEGSGIQKQGIMETPLLETDNEKQAF